MNPILHLDAVHVGCRSLAIAGGRYTFLATGADTANAYTLIEATIPARDPGPPPHTHTCEDEAFYVLDGELTMTLGERDRVVTAGGFVMALRNQRHKFRNDLDAPARFLILITPAGLERFFEDIGGDWRHDRGLPPPPTAEDIQRIIDVAPRYGMTLHLGSAE